MKTLTDNQKKAFDWWDSLSINEMKTLAGKYYPVFSHNVLYKMGPWWIEDIYNQEHRANKEN